MTQLFTDIDALAALVPDGASVAVAKEPSAPTALAGALIRRGARDLHLITVPTAAYIADLLIGAGAIGVLETSGVSLGEFGPAPRFISAVKASAVELRDSTCPAIYAAVQAGEKGQPFATLRGLIGSDLMTHRPDYRVIDNPLVPGDPVVVMPPIRPDFTLIHADLADRFGNVYIGGRHEVKALAHAAKAALVTVEEVTEHDLRADPLRSPNLIDPLYLGGVAEAPGGAWPTAAPGRYALDEAALASYAAGAKTEAGFTAWLNDHIFTPRRAA